MKTHCKILATALAAALRLAWTLALPALSAHAAVPLAWDVRPGQPAPVMFDRYHGETLSFSATFRGFGELPFSPGADIRLWYQTNGMGQAWWSAPATVSSNILTAVWTPELDPGAERVSLFFGAPSNAYAAAVLRLRHSPGFTPANPPPPAAFEEADPLFAAWLASYTPPDTSLEPATNYTDSVALGKVSKAGDSMSGALELRNVKFDPEDLRVPHSGGWSLPQITLPAANYGSEAIRYTPLATSSSRVADYLLTFPSKSGRIALTNDIAAATNAVLSNIDATLRSGYTEWGIETMPDAWSLMSCTWNESLSRWECKILDKDSAEVLTMAMTGAQDALFITDGGDINLVRTRITPTKTSQLANDGDGTNRFATVNQIPDLADATNNVFVGGQTASRQIAIGLEAEASASGSNNQTRQAVAVGAHAKAMSEASVAVGSQAKSTAGGEYNPDGGFSVAVGYRAAATGRRSIAIGSATEGAATSLSTTEATNTSSIAIGSKAVAYALGDVVIGTDAKGVANIASDTLGVVAVGYKANANGTASIAVGNEASAGKMQAAAIGRSASASGTRSAAVGGTAAASGRCAVAVGFGALATGNGATALGGGDGISNSGAKSVAAGDEAVQLGGGTNSTAKTLQFRDYQLLDEAGNIPEERVAHAISVAVTNATAAAIAPIQAETALVYRLYSGSNVVAEVTNYNSQVHAPELRLMQLNESNEYITVWTETNGLARTLAKANEYTDAAITNRAAPRAWSKVTAGLGFEAPSNTTWLSTGHTVIAGGLEYEKHMTSGGAIWLLESNGMTADFHAQTNNTAFIDLSNADGTPIFRVEKTDSFLVGVHVDRVTVDGSALVCGVNVVAADHPLVRVKASLESGEWAKEEDGIPASLATVTWSGTAGNWTCRIQNNTGGNTLFAQMEYFQEGGTKIVNSAALDVSQGILCNDGIHKVRPVYNGGNITWEVVP